MTLKEFNALLEAFIIQTYNQREHSTTKEQPLQRWLSEGFLPHLPPSLEKLDLLLLSVAKSRKIRRDGIFFHNFRYLHSILANFIGESVSIRYDPRDLTQISVFFQQQFLCHASCQELAGHALSLKEIIQARRKTRTKRKQILNRRQNLLSEVLANRASTKTPEPYASPLKRYQHE